MKARFVVLTHIGADPQIAHVVDEEEPAAAWTFCGEPISQSSKLLGENTLRPICDECIRYVLSRAEHYREEARQLDDLHGRLARGQEGER